MIVIAIIAILVALAVPAYQDYAVRTKVGECVANTAPAKLAVAETYQSEGNLPADGPAAGFSFNATTYCSGITILGGTISATTANTGAAAAGGSEGTITLTPTPAGPQLNWDCAQTGFTKTAHVPASCR
jgi:type IV pilus assembly protein PilA/type IV pilus assembly protein PilE